MRINFYLQQNAAAAAGTAVKVLSELGNLYYESQLEHWVSRVGAVKAEIESRTKPKWPDIS